MKTTFILICFTVMAVPSLAQLPKLILPIGHTHKITVAAFSPDGKRVVTGSADKTLKIWDTQTGRLLANLKGHTGDVNYVAYNQQGNRIISTAALDSTAILWDAGSGKVIRRFTPSRYSVEYAKFSPDGRFLVVDGVREIFDVSNGEKITTLSGYGSFDQAIFIAGSQTLLAVESNKTTQYDLAGGQRLKGFRGGDPAVVTPDQKFLVTSSYDKKAYIWDLASGDSLGALNLDEKPYGIFVSPTGTSAVTYEQGSGKFKLWNLGRRRMLGEIGTGYSSTRVHFSDDGNFVYLSDGIYTTRCFSTEDAKKQAFPNDGKLLGITGKPATMILNEGYDKTVLHTSSGKTELKTPEGISAVWFNSRGTEFLGAYGNGQAGIWKPGNGAMVSQLKGFARQVSNVEQSGNHYAVQLENQVNLLTLRNNLLEPASAPLNDRPERMFFSPDGKHIVTISVNKDRESVFDPEKLVSLWDLQSGNLVKKNLWERGMQDISIANEGSHRFSEDGKLFFAWNELGYCYVFSIPGGKLLTTVETPRLWYAFINPSFTRLAYQVAPMNTEQPATILIRDLASGTILRELNAETSGWEKFRLLNGTDHFLVFDVENISVYDLKRKSPLIRMPNGRNSLTPDHQRILIQQYDKVGVWDLHQAKKIFQLDKSGDISFWTAEWTPGFQQVVVSHNDGRIEVLDAVTGSQVAQMNGYATRLKFSVSGKWLFALHKEQVSVFDTRNWTLVARLEGHEHNVKDVFETAGGTRLLSFGEDNTARLWDVATGKLLYSQAIFDKELQFTMLPGGYYMANPEASKVLHFVTPELDVVSFEQLDIRFNRPDLVLGTIDPGNTVLIQSYHSAWQKRLKKLGVDSSSLVGSFSVPRAYISDRDKVAYEQAGRSLSLRFVATDSLFALKSFNVWVNESPVFGQKGRALAAGKKQSLDTVLNVPLSSGKNVIEFSVTNAAGSESYRMPLEVNHTGSSTGITRFIGFGVDTYKDSRHDLLFSVKDIRDLATGLKERLGDKVQVDTFFNATVGKAAIEKLKASLAKGSVDDRLIVAYSGHGLLSDKFDYYLSLPSTNFDRPEQGSLPYEELESLLDGIPARQKLLLIDACHSGEVDKDDLEKLNETPDSLVKGLKPVAYKKEGQLGLANSFELMQSIFANVGKGTGATVISAAAGTQFALERSDLRNGVFTYSILELMRGKPNASISELKRYIAQRVVQLTNGLQRPTFRNESRIIDWNVW